MFFPIKGTQKSFGAAVLGWCPRFPCLSPLACEMAAGHKRQDPHTLLSEAGTEVDTGMAYVLLGLLLIRRETDVPASQWISMHISLVRFHLLATSNGKTGKENSSLSKPLYRGQTREYVVHQQPLCWSPAQPVRALGTFPCIGHLTVLV